MTPFTQASTFIKEKAFPAITGFIFSSYEWVRQEDNQKTITSLIKNFWSYEMLKQLLFNFPWTFVAWIKILAEKSMVIKFPAAIKRAMTLSGMLVMTKETPDLLKIINWIFIRLVVNPRKTLNILSRATTAKRLICNGDEPTPQGPRGGTQKWLGYCFFEKNGKGGKGLGKNGLKLKEDIKTFFETGENLKDKSRKTKKE